MTVKAQLTSRAGDPRVRARTRVRMSLRVLVGLCGFATFAASTWSETTVAPRVSDWNVPPGFDDYINASMRDWGIPGLALAIVSGDKVVYAHGYGVRNIESREPVTPNTVFGVGSVTKSFTATAMAMLVDEGKMDWDRPVKDYVPYFETYDPYVTSVLSPRDLACHRTGIEQANYLQWRPTDRADNAFHPTRADIVRAFKYLQPSEGFRSKFSYKNDTWVVAGAVIEAQSGVSWDQFVHERIFKPLGMTRSGTSVLETDALQDVSSAHVVTGGKLKPINLILTDVAGPMGSINTSAVDLAQYVRFHLGNGTFDGARLLSSAQLSELHRPQMIDAGEVLTSGTPFAKQVSYGLGWWVQDYRGTKLVHHAGEIVGGCANVFFLPDQGFGIVLIANADAIDLLGAMALTTIDRYLRAPVYDWNARALALNPERLDKEHGPEFLALLAEQSKHRVPGTKPSLPLGSYVGTYHNDAYGDLHITLSGSTLQARIWTFTGEMTHWNYDTFRFKWDDRHYYLHVIPERQNLVHFEIDERGKPSQVGFLSMGTFTRRDSPLSIH